MTMLTIDIAINKLGINNVTTNSGIIEVEGTLANDDKAWKYLQSSNIDPNGKFVKLLHEAQMVVESSIFQPVKYMKKFEQLQEDGVSKAMAINGVINAIISNHEINPNRADESEFCFQKTLMSDTEELIGNYSELRKEIVDQYFKNGLSNDELNNIDTVEQLTPFLGSVDKIYEPESDFISKKIHIGQPHSPTVIIIWESNYDYVSEIKEGDQIVVTNIQPNVWEGEQKSEDKTIVTMDSTPETTIMNMKEVI